MKKIIIFFCLVLLLVFTLSACRVEPDPLPDSDSDLTEIDGSLDSENPDENDSENDDKENAPDYEKVVLPPPKNAVELDGEYVPDFLDNSQQQLYLDAKAAFSQFNMMCDGFGSTESGTPVTINSFTYYPANGKYTDWNRFETAMLSLFTPEYFAELNTKELPNGTYQHFINYNGKLYYTFGARGGDITCVGLDSFKLVSHTQNAIDFNVVGVYYADFDFNTDNLTTEEKNLKLVYTSIGWRFSLFALIY